MDIRFNTLKKRQTLGQYNLNIEGAEAENERGEFITAENLKKKLLHSNYLE